jgi:hypothetical protein
MWRLRLLDQYTATMEHAILTAYNGEASLEQSASIMAQLGMRGVGTVKHLGLNISAHTFTANTFFEIGAHTTAIRTPRNDSSVILQTRTRMYLVSQSMLEGSPLSMRETRITAPLTADCALIIHSNLGHYKVVQAGGLDCRNRDGSTQHYELKLGVSVHLDSSDVCSNRCLAIGHIGYHTQHRSLAMMPSVHPPSLIVYQENGDDGPSPRRVADRSHQVAHDIISNDIRSNRDMIGEFEDRYHAGPDLGHVTGSVGAVLSLLCTLAVLFVVLRCARRRCARDATPHHTPADDVELAAMHAGSSL